MVNNPQPDFSKETDVVFHGLRPSALVGEPVEIGPVWFATDMYIASNRGVPTEKHGQVTDAFGRWSPVVYGYCLILASIAAVLLAILTNIIDGRGNQSTLQQILRKARFLVSSSVIRRRFQRLISQYFRALWHMLETMLDQENYQPVSDLAQLLWLFVCTAIFITIFGFWVNLISTDIVAQQYPPPIDSLDDILNEPRFAHPYIIAPKTFEAHERLYNAPPGSVFNRIYESISKQANCSNPTDFTRCPFFEIRTELTNNLQNLIPFFADKFRNDGFGILGCRVLIDNAKTMLCRTMPHLGEEFHTSPPVSEDYDTMMSRKGLDSEVSRFVHQMVRTSMVESALVQHTLDSVAEATLNKYMPLSVTYYECLDNRKETDVDEEVANIVLQLTAISNLMIAISIALLVALLILLWELLIHKTTKAQTRPLFKPIGTRRAIESTASIAGLPAMVGSRLMNRIQLIQNAPESARLKNDNVS